MSIQTRIEETKKRSKTIWNIALIILGLGLLYGAGKTAYDVITFVRNLQKQNLKLVLNLEIQNTRTNSVRFKSECSYYLFDGGPAHYQYFDNKELRLPILRKDATNNSPDTNIYILNPQERGMYKVSFPDSHRSIVWMETALVKLQIEDRKGSNLVEQIIPFQKKSFKKSKHHLQF